MGPLPRAMFWRRIDATGCEQIVFDDRRGLRARGVQLGADPVPYSGRYDLDTDDRWASMRLQVTVEGAGFLRMVRLERAAGRWRVTASEQGDLARVLRAAGHAGAGLPGMEDPGRLAATVDVDLAHSPLTNTLPVRRLGLLEAGPGASHTIDVAWILMPSLEVISGRHTYTVLGPNRIRFATGEFAADISLDRDGYVTYYPGLAERG